MGYPCYLLPTHIRSSQSASTFHGWLLRSDVGSWQMGSLLGFDSYVFVQGHLVMVLVVSVVFLVLWFWVKNLGKLGCHFSSPALFYPSSCRSCLTLHPVFVFLPLFGLPWFVSATKAAYTPYTPQKGYITFYAKSGISKKKKKQTKNENKLEGILCSPPQEKKNPKNMHTHKNKWDDKLRLQLWENELAWN